MKKQNAKDSNRPLGVWCLPLSGELVKPEAWSPEHIAQGCLVVTKETAFIVSLHPSVAMQWGAMDKAQHPLVTDVKSYDSKAATDAMLKAYEGVSYEDPDGEIWNIDGAPAARWCREYSSGNIPAGQWDLPTLSVCQLIHEHRDEINRCLKAMCGWKITPGWMWSSTADADRSRCAWAVLMDDGSTDWYGKYNFYQVRAVTAFQL